MRLQRRVSSATVPLVIPRVRGTRGAARAFLILCWREETGLGPCPASYSRHSSKTWERFLGDISQIYLFGALPTTDPSVIGGQP